MMAYIAHTIRELYLNPSHTTVELLGNKALQDILSIPNFGHTTNAMCSLPVFEIDTYHISPREASSIYIRTVWGHVSLAWNCSALNFVIVY